MQGRERKESRNAKASELNQTNIAKQRTNFSEIPSAREEMATSDLTSPMPGQSPFDYFCFDPQIDYAQVLAEAQQHQDGEQEVPSLSHLKAPLDHLHKSAEDLKKRKSWKSSLCFWKKSSEKKKQMNRAISVLKSKAMPIYMSDIAPPYRSGRPSSSPLAAMYSALQRSKTDVPYMPLVRHSHSRVSLSRPIYLVT